MSSSVLLTPFSPTFLPWHRHHECVTLSTADLTALAALYPAKHEVMLGWAIKAGFKPVWLSEEDNQNESPREHSVCFYKKYKSSQSASSIWPIHPPVFFFTFLICFSFFVVPLLSFVKIGCCSKGVVVQNKKSHKWNVRKGCFLWKFFLISEPAFSLNKSWKDFCYNLLFSACVS